MIGSLLLGAPPDRCLEFLPSLQPFPTKAAFHDWLSWLWRRRAPDPQLIEDPWRRLLPDDGPVVFTHGDIRPANVIVSATDPPQIVTIVDWEQAGWYPAYWEYCKARFTTRADSEWSSWINAFLEPHPAAFEAFDFYTFTLGAF